MASLLIEVELPDGSRRDVGLMKPGDQPGTLSDCHALGRDLIMFECFATHALISIAAPGVDVAIGPDRLLINSHIQHRTLALLQDGEIHSRTIRTDAGHTWRACFTFTKDDVH